MAPGLNSSHITLCNTKELSQSRSLYVVRMSGTRHYTDAALRELVNDLDEGQKTMLRVGGALPKEPFGELHLSLRSSDVARMIELIEEK
jgi:hypothetical protein